MALQAMEAEDNGMVKLAETVKHVLRDSVFGDHIEVYSYSELKDDVKKSLWKTAMHVMQYHDIDSLDIQKFDEKMETLAEKYVKDIETAIGKKESDIGPHEPSVPGQSK